MLFHYFEGHFVPKEKVHPKLWVGADRRFKDISRNDREIKRKNRVSFLGFLFMPEKPIHQAVAD